MYGPLLMLIILTPIFLLALAFVIIPSALCYHYRQKCHYYDDRPYCHEWTYFGDYRREVDYLESEGRQEELNSLREAHHKRIFWSKIEDKVRTIAIIITIIVGLALFIFGLMSIMNSISTMHEVAYWENFVEMVNTTIDGASTIENAGISGDIIEYNTWLTRVKTSQELYGNWSMYYWADLSRLQYIKIGQ
jgi:hypothetical protein